MGSVLEGSFWHIFFSFPPNAADVQVVGDRAFASKTNWPALKTTANELSAAKLNSHPLEILRQRWDWDCTVIVRIDFMPNHPNGFGAETDVRVSRRCPDGERRVGQKPTVVNHLIRPDIPSITISTILTIFDKNLNFHILMVIRRL
jgi:hypothetical protein